MLSDVDERELVNRLRRGEQHALAQLIARYERNALRRAMVILNSLQDAEDIVQEAFLVAWDKRDTLHEDALFWPWFYAVLINEARSILRWRKRWWKRLISSDTLNEEEINLFSPAPGLEDIVMAEDVCRTVRKCIL